MLDMRMTLERTFWRWPRRFGLMACLVAGVICTARLARAQVPLDILHTFTGDSNEYGGPVRSALVQASDGNFYGWTSSDRYPQGMIFRTRSNGAVDVLHAFTGCADGCYPSSLIQASDGNIYGTANGGASNDGTIFRMTL